MNRLLIDECLSVTLVAVAKTRGLAAEHVAHLGKSGWQDWNLVPFADDHDIGHISNPKRD